MSAETEKLDALFDAITEILANVIWYPVDEFNTEEMLVRTEYINAAQQAFDNYCQELESSDVE